MLPGPPSREGASPPPRACHREPAPAPSARLTTATRTPVSSPARRSPCPVRQRHQQEATRGCEQAEGRGLAPREHRPLAPDPRGPPRRPSARAAQAPRGRPLSPAGGNDPPGMDQDPEDACGSPAPVPLYWGSDQHWPPVPTGPGLDRKGARGRRGLSLGDRQLRLLSGAAQQRWPAAPPLTEAAGQGGCPPLPAWWPPAGQPLLPPRLTPQVLLAGIKRDKLCRALTLGPGMSLSIP